MPIILEFTFNDSTKQTVRIAAEIWRRNEKNTSKVFVMDKQVASVRLDPMRETADIDETNNNWPMKAEPSRFEIYKAGVTNARNPGSRAPSPMQKQLK